MFSGMKKYRVREGSVTDVIRAGVIGAAFWAVLIATMITSYPA